MKRNIITSVIATLIIFMVVSIFFLIATFISKILDLPSSLHLPAALRVAGAVMLGAGIALTLWLFKYRKPAAMLISTYFTFRKMLTGTPIKEMSGRAEPLIISGPQRYVRHPLYLGAIFAFWGWGLATGMTSTLIAALFILLWFRFVQIPFEEKEMRALFGEQYVTYMHNVPMLIPFTKHKGQ